MRCTTAYSSSCSRLILIYLHPFRRNSLFCSNKSPKSLKPPIFSVQGHSRSLMLTFLRSSSPVLVTISSVSVPICNHFHVRRANNGRITPFKGDAPLSPHRSWGPSLPSGMKFCHKILETLSCHMVKTRSLYLTCLEMVPGRDRHQDGRTDGRTELP